MRECNPRAVGGTRAWIRLLTTSLVLTLAAAAPTLAHPSGATVTFFHSPTAEAKWVHFTPPPPGDPDTWSIKLRLPCAIGDFSCYAGAELHNVAGPPPTVPPAFDFRSTVTSPGGGSPRLVMCFSDGANCSSRMELRPLVWVANVWTHEDGNGIDWDNNGGTCGYRYATTYNLGVACHPGATVTDVFVVTDSAWLAGPYIHYIDNIRYGAALITSPRSSCGNGNGNGDGDGEFEDNDGHKQCENGRGE